MSQPIDPTESLPAGVAGRINPVCDRFEAAWQTGGRPRLEEFLPDGEAADQPWLLRDLLRLELYYRGRSGETPTAEEYRRRLPDHAALIEKAFAALPTADPHATRYSDTPAIADPHATRYSDPPAVEAPSSRLPRRFGGYELLEEIGHGGMGVVYKARQFSPERLVALKVIRAGQLADEEDVRRFRQEADEAARLDHPNIVPVYEVGEQDGLHFFTMKLVEGGGLDKHLERYRNNPKAAARLLATAARAVHHAHQRQLLHRDLKPGNILLDAANQPHVADFGLAKRMEGDVAAMTRSNAIVGTPEYMAPEQAGGEKRLTTAVDVYALGGVLYALLTGRPPFQAKALLDVLEKVVSEAPAPPSKVRPGAPRDLETICLKCLAKEPAKRYGSAEALAEDLGRYLAGEPVWARPVGVGERAVRWVRRRPAVAAFLALFILSLLGGTAVSLYFAGTANNALSTVTAREKQLNDANVLLKENNKQLEETIVRGWLGPLGHQVNTALTDPEIDSLRQLAGGNERLRLLFVEQALQRPQTTVQLRNRADLAIHAAVGLNPLQRQKAEEALLARLRDEQSDFDLRTSCALIGAALDDWSPEFPSVAARQAVDAMAKTDDPVAAANMVKAVAVLAPRLEPAEAARLTSAAAHRALSLMAKTDNDAGLDALVEALAALAPHLGPAEASAAARDALDAMDQKEKASVLLPFSADYVMRDLAQALAALAPRLEPAEAARLASAAADKISGMMLIDPIVGHSDLAEGLAALAPHLQSAEASRAAWMALDKMSKTSDSTELGAWGKALAALATRLEPATASEYALSALDEMASTQYPHKLRALAQASAALTSRLSPTEAGRPQHYRHLGFLERPLILDELEPAPEPARLASDAARRIEDVRAKATPSEVADLAQALTALAPRLEPAAASAAASQILDAMAKTYPNDSPALAQALAALAPRLEPAEAARLTSAAARQTLEMMAKVDPYSLPDLARALAALAPRLEPAEAARLGSAAARQVLDAMAKTDNFWHSSMPLPKLTLPGAGDIPAPIMTRGMLAEEALGALAPLLEPAEASAVARQLLDAMVKADDPFDTYGLSQAFAALVSRLGPAEASVAARQALDAMAKANRPYDMSQELAPYLGPTEAVRQASAREASGLMDAMPKESHPADPANRLAVLIGPFAPGDTSGRISSLALAVGSAGTPPTVFTVLGPLTDASWSPPGRLTEQQLVDLLKMPTCQQPARQVIVRQLGWQCGQHFDTMWQFVEWAKKNRPDLDLTSPPVRMETPGPKP